MALLVLMALLLTGCNLLSPISSASATPSPTVTLTPGPGATMPAITPSPLPVTPSAANPTPSPAPPTLTATPTRLPATRPAPTAGAAASATSVPVGAPHIDFFSASPDEIDPGQSFVLSWKAVGEMATLYPVNSLGQLASPGAIVDLEGTTTVTTDSSVRNSVRYMLFVIAGSNSVSATAQVKVRCPDTWFFSNPPATCPSTSAILSQGAYEHFEHGLMLWLGGNNMIYVLYGDAIASPRWSTYQNSWEQGMLDSDPSIIPPPGLYQPIRGFGLLWRTEAAGQPYSPRGRLGWATEPESPYTAAFQCDSAPKYSSCYIQGPAGETIWLKPESSGWQVWTGPS